MAHRSKSSASPVVDLYLYFGLACAITWAPAYPLVSSWVKGSTPPAYGLPLAGVGAVGPLLAAWVLARRRGELRSVFGVWRTAPVWVAIGLLTVPSQHLVANCLDVALGRQPTQWFYPPTQAVQIVAVVGIPVLEEFGWRGFAYPRAAARYGPVLGALLVGAVWLVCALGCSQTAGGGGGDGGERFAEWASALCTCDGAADPEAQCAELTHTRLETQVGAEVDSGRVVLNEAHLKECLQASHGCPDGTIAACDDIFDGTLAEGEPCTIPYQCKEGVCRLQRQPGDDACPAVGVCTRVPGPGEPCESDVGCSGDSVCIGDGTGGLVCGDALERGAQCPEGDSRRPANPVCAGGLVCVPDDAQGAVCGDRPGEGEACEIPLTAGGNIVVISCAEGFACGGSVGSGTCRPSDSTPPSEPTPEGGFCTQPFDCGPDRTCDDGACVPRRANSAKCSNAWDCYGTCVQGECVNLYDACVGDGSGA